MGEKGFLKKAIIEAVKSRTGAFTSENIYNDVKEIVPSTTIGSTRTYLNPNCKSFIGVVESLPQKASGGKLLYKYKEINQADIVDTTAPIEFTQEETVEQEETFHKTNDVSAIQIGEGIIALLKSKDKEITKLKDTIETIEHEQKMNSSISHVKLKELQATISRLNDKIITQNRKIHKYENPTKKGFPMSELAKFILPNNKNNND